MARAEASIDLDSNPISPLQETDEPKIIKIRKIELEVNDPDISMCGCHCISYCTCNCDRGGIVS